MQMVCAEEANIVIKVKKKSTILKNYAHNYYSSYLKRIN